MRPEKFSIIVFFVSLYVGMAQTDSSFTKAERKYRYIVKLHEQCFENDLIRFRRFSWPYLSLEMNGEDDITWAFALKYSYYNYKNDDYLPTLNYYKYYGQINHKINLELGLRWYVYRDLQKTYGKGLFMPALFSLGYYRSDSDIVLDKFSFWVPSLGVGLGYQNFIKERISWEVEVLFKKGFKATYLNGSPYRQADRNYNNLSLRIGLGYKI
ncbi:MAG TPA: hypothetical protein VL947_13360 [Cytophagales bacterium]|nr:hypothetical protein [Cytophagales bacterium]